MSIETYFAVIASLLGGISIIAFFLMLRDLSKSARERKPAQGDSEPRDDEESRLEAIADKYRAVKQGLGLLLLDVVETDEKTKEEVWSSIKSDKDLLTDIYFRVHHLPRFREQARERIKSYDRIRSEIEAINEELRQAGQQIEHRQQISSS